MRIAIVDKDKCMREKCGYQCMKVCPGVRMGDETITLDEQGYPVISEFLCVGHGICVRKCPANAIKIINLKREGLKTIYQYGVNSFRFFSLPILPEGSCGFIGKNGIGKTTALKLLSGQLIPNFGDVSKQYSFDEIKDKINIQSRKFLENVNSKNFTISYKLQNIEKLSKYSESVKDLLKTLVQDKDLIDETVKKFKIQKLLDKKLNHLSGGELQLVAIAISYAKKADLYYFDEPSTYLDIEQRINIAQAIKEKKRSIIVEHDLAVLDYVSDYVYIFYGEENAYGITSHLKSARTGINEYLRGYLKDENLRFRNHEIEFIQLSSKKTEGQIKFSYPKLAKKFDTFSFESDKGEIKEGEIIGLVGKNATGKTLFVKMLAGELEPDNTKLDTKLKIAYKPQYIKLNDENTVLTEILSAKPSLKILEECKRKLGLQSFFEKKIKHLSGGEKQRVAIAKTLSTQADIYLFDEPSAFLDIEQRLAFSELLKNFILESDKSAFVVDHDIVLIDSISSRVMLFEGESSKWGKARMPETKIQGMNEFLKSMDITMRRDVDTKRPRVNKKDSTLDKKQRLSGEYYAKV